MKNKFLEIKNLTIGYGNNKIAVNNASLSVEEGSIVTIVGQSGSGKSTFIHSILGLLPSSAIIHEGQIKYYDYNLEKMDSKLRRKISGKEISMIFQDSESHMDPIKKIKYQFDEFLKSHKKFNKKELLDLELSVLKKMGFKEPLRVLNSYPFELSGGMQQRVSLAMAIALKPKLILADEPTSALDVTLQREIIKQMIELSKSINTAVLLVTHNMGVASYISDKIAVMNEGKIVEFGSRDKIINFPQDDYTKLLLSSVPSLKEKRFEI